MGARRDARPAQLGASRRRRGGGRHGRRRPRAAARPPARPARTRPTCPRPALPPSAPCAICPSRPAGCSTAAGPRASRQQLPGSPWAPARLPASPHGHLLSPPLARDRRLLLELRAPDLPGLHDQHPGRDALPGVRLPAHQGRAPARDAERPGRHLRADRDQRDRVPGRGRRRAHVLGVQPREPLHQRRPDRELSPAKGSPTGNGGGSSPPASCTRTSSTSGSTCGSSTTSA